jgi:hypothetical protein
MALASGWRSGWIYGAAPASSAWAVATALKNVEQKTPPGSAARRRSAIPASNASAALTRTTVAANGAR